MCHNFRDGGRGPQAMVHRRPCLQHWRVAALTQAIKPDIGLELLFLPTPPAFDAPVRGVLVGILFCRSARKKLQWRGYSTVKKIWWYVYSFWHNSRTWQTDTHTDTAWRHRPRLRIALHAKKSIPHIPSLLLSWRQCLSHSCVTVGKYK